MERMGTATSLRQHGEVKVTDPVVWVHDTYWKQHVSYVHRNINELEQSTFLNITFRYSRSASSVQKISKTTSTAVLVMCHGCTAMLDGHECYVYCYICTCFKALLILNVTDII